MSRFRFKPILWTEDDAVGNPYGLANTGFLRTTDPAFPRVNEIFQDTDGNLYTHKIENGLHKYPKILCEEEKYRPKKIFTENLLEFDHSYGQPLSLFKAGDYEFIHTSIYNNGTNNNTIIVYEDKDYQHPTHLSIESVNDSTYTASFKAVFMIPSSDGSLSFAAYFIVGDMPQKVIISRSVSGTWSVTPSTNFSDDFNLCTDIVNDENSGAGVFLAGTKTGGNFKVYSDRYSSSGENTFEQVYSNGDNYGYGKAKLSVMGITRNPKEKSNIIFMIAAELADDPVIDVFRIDTNTKTALSYRILKYTGHGSHVTDNQYKALSITKLSDNAAFVSYLDNDDNRKFDKFVYNGGQSIIPLSIDKIGDMTWLNDHTFFFLHESVCSSTEFNQIYCHNNSTVSKINISNRYAEFSVLYSAVGANACGVDENGVLINCRDGHSRIMAFNGIAHDLGNEIIAENIDAKKISVSELCTNVIDSEIRYVSAYSDGKKTWTQYADRFVYVTDGYFNHGTKVYGDLGTYDSYTGSRYFKSRSSGQRMVIFNRDDTYKVKFTSKVDDESDTTFSTTFIQPKEGVEFIALKKDSTEWTPIGYISKKDAEDIYLAKTDAASTYLTLETASSTYLKQTDATSTYLNKNTGMMASGANLFLGRETSEQGVYTGGLVVAKNVNFTNVLDITLNETISYEDLASYVNMKSNATADVTITVPYDTRNDIVGMRNFVVVNRSNSYSLKIKFKGSDSGYDKIATFSPSNGQRAYLLVVVPIWRSVQLSAVLFTDFDGDISLN